MKENIIKNKYPKTISILNDEESTINKNDITKIDSINIDLN